MIPLLNQRQSYLHDYNTCYYEQLSFASEVTSRSAGTRVFCNSVPGETKCHPSILNSRQMAPKPRRNVLLTAVFYFLFLACSGVCWQHRREYYRL